MLQIVMNTDEKKYGGQGMINGDQYVQKTIRKRFVFIYFLSLCLWHIFSFLFLFFCELNYPRCADVMVCRTVYKCLFLVEVHRFVTCRLINVISFYTL